tara:strand:- start:487 stop:750 length:264 start_codon:yes stop_codon:yes gene_type:complete
VAQAKQDINGDSSAHELHTIYYLEAIPGSEYTQFQFEGRRRGAQVKYDQMMGRVSHSSFDKKTNTLNISKVQRDTLSNIGHELDNTE